MMHLISRPLPDVPVPNIIACTTLSLVRGAGPVASYAALLRTSLYFVLSCLNPPTPVHDLGHGRLVALLPAPATSVWALGARHRSAWNSPLACRVVREQLKLLVILDTLQRQSCPVCLRDRLIMCDQLD